MKLFQCQCCGQLLYFENTECLGCGHPVGYLPRENRMVAVRPDGAVWHVLPGTGAGSLAGPLRFCRNWERSACNWMLEAGSQAGPDEAVAATKDEYCLACQHNRTVPDLSVGENLSRWMRTEAAKRRLFYSLLRLDLPRPLQASGHPEPLVFDVLSDDPSRAERIMTGHADGVITIALTEADDAEREKRRHDMGEAYRTLLGHFRHEVGHYYWDILVRDGPALNEFRSLFGDERADYAAAIDTHYREGAPAGWEEAHVSAYATVHPWEDWAETWAHYLHMVDTLETAHDMGLRVGADAGAAPGLVTDLDQDPYRTADAQRLIADWVPLTLALNSLNRSMGLPDLYPFSIAAAVRTKLAFVHGLIGGKPG